MVRRLLRSEMLCTSVRVPGGEGQRFAELVRSIEKSVTKGVRGLALHRLGLGLGLGVSLGLGGHIYRAVTVLQPLSNTWPIRLGSIQ